MSSANELLVGYFQQLLLVTYLIAFTIGNLWDSYAAWLLLTFHATYGLMWAHKLTLGYTATSHLDIVRCNDIMLASFLIYVHWLFPLLPLLLIGITRPQLTYVGITLAWLLFIWGSFYQFVSDVHFTLFMAHQSEMQRIKDLLPPEYQELIEIEPRPKANLWSITRHPNYFGELLIFFSFIFCSASVLPLILLAAIVLFLWIPAIHQSDKELEKDPTGDTYQASTSKLIPFIY